MVETLECFHILLNQYCISVVMIIVTTIISLQQLYHYNNVITTTMSSLQQCHRYNMHNDIATCTMISLQQCYHSHVFFISRSSGIKVQIINDNRSICDQYNRIIKYSKGNRNKNQRNEKHLHTGDCHDTVMTISRMY